jgi:hypothetical protein
VVKGETGMPTQTTPQTVLDAVTYAQYAHLTEAHGGQLTVWAGCATCLALAHAVQVAHQREAPHARPLEEYCERGKDLQ